MLSEKHDLSDAPVHLSADSAGAWLAGWNAAVEALKVLEAILPNCPHEGRSPMTPADYRAALARLGWSIVGAGPRLGVTGRQSQRWASGFTPIPKHTQILLEVLADSNSRSTASK
jgi:hypothetical protein